MSRRTHFVVTEDEPITAGAVMTSLCGTPVRILEELMYDGDLRRLTDFRGLSSCKKCQKHPLPNKCTVAGGVEEQ